MNIVDFSDFCGKANHRFVDEHTETRSIYMLYFATTQIPLFHYLSSNPAWMNYVYMYDLNRFAQFANRVWDVEIDLNESGGDVYSYNTTLNEMI
jgi:hypothetical protein